MAFPAELVCRDMKTRQVQVTPNPGAVTERWQWIDAHTFIIYTSDKKSYVCVIK
jgi:hypothetical protein